MTLLPSTRRVRSLSRSASAVEELAKKVELSVVISRLPAFQRAKGEAHTLPQNPPNSGSEMQLLLRTFFLANRLG